MAMSASSWTPPVTLSPKLSIWSRAFIIGLAICNASKGFTFRRTLCWNNKRKYELEYQGLSLLQSETFPSWRSQTGYRKSWAKTVQRQMIIQKPTKELNKTSGARFEPLPLVNTVMSHYFCYIFPTSIMSPHNGFNSQMTPLSGHHLFSGQYLKSWNNCKKEWEI